MRERILVVDDTPANLQLLTNLLRSQGYTVHPASDGRLALEFVQSTRPDLILLDVRMPGIDGYEVCRQLKADERIRDVPVIFVTILEDEHDKVKGFRVGAVDYITKPFQPEEVIARVRTHLRLWELTGQLEQKVNERTEELVITNQRLHQEIAERKRAEDELHKSENRLMALNVNLEKTIRDLAAINKEVESFSYSVAHDLRNPLKVIKGFADFLTEDYAERLDEEGRNFLKEIENNADKMNLIISDILALSKISQQEIEITDLDLSKMAHSVINELSVAYPGRKVEAKIQEGLKTRADARLLHVTLANLFGNAWKYTEKLEHPKIEFGFFEKDGQRIFYVKDNGAGFDMRQAGKLFLPFMRLHSEKDFKGTGVGLASVERAVNRHGGKVWAEGEVGKGAVFYFTLGAHEPVSK